jgi:hypothetical protein
MEEGWVSEERRGERKNWHKVTDSGRKKDRVMVREEVGEGKARGRH